MNQEFSKLTDDELDDLMSSGRLQPLEKLLLSLATSSYTLPSATQVGLKASDHGWSINYGEIADTFREVPMFVVFKRNGYKLTTLGKQTLQRAIAKASNLPAANAITHLRDVLGKITNEKIREFVDEAIQDIEIGSHRSAVILSWCGAIGILQEHVAKTDLAKFNAEAKKVKQNWKEATGEADIRKMMEADFLTVICNMGIVDKNVKQELEKALTLRNGCGHPSEVVPGASKVEAHVEDLVTYVFSKFG